MYNCCRNTSCSVNKWYVINLLKAQEIRYARCESDHTLRSQGTYSDKIRLERKAKRDQKAEDKLLAKRTKLAAKEETLREKLAVSNEYLKQGSDTLVLQGLPSSFGKVLFLELLKPYKQVVDYELDSSTRSAKVSFESIAAAKVALAGLTGFKVDEHHALTANFTRERIEP